MEYGKKILLYGFLLPHPDTLLTGEGTVTVTDAVTWYCYFPEIAILLYLNMEFERDIVGRW